MALDRDGFEQALEDAIELMAAPPSVGGAEDARLQGLLAQITAYRDQSEPEERAAVAQIESAFDERLKALESERRADAKGYLGGERPGGLGPTLGMDVTRS